MANFESNINVTDVLAQREQTTFVKKENTFNEANYLQARLADGETTKTLVIRLLPYESNCGTPFHEVWMHMVRVSKDVSKSGWKSFPCPTHNKIDDKCPFCAISKASRDKMNEVTDEALKKKIGEMEYANRAKKYWVVRCIQRGAENEGVKFWLFPHSKKGDGVYDKIFNKFNNRAEVARLQGKECNIFDLNTGRDIIVTLTRGADGKTATDIDVADESTPLTIDYNQGINWINDTKRWQDVFTVKNYEYMKIISQGGVPMFNKEKGTYVDKNATTQETTVNEYTETPQEIIPQTPQQEFVEELPF